MEHEYAVKISLTEHTHDNLAKPYYWCLMMYNTTHWVQIAGSWNTSPSACMAAALAWYESHSLS